jgi:hypothetical protein
MDGEPGTLQAMRIHDAVSMQTSLGGCSTKQFLVSDL